MLNAQHTAKALVATLRFLEKPDIQFSQVSHLIPLAPAKTRLPWADSSLLSLAHMVGGGVQEMGGKKKDRSSWRSKKKNQKRFNSGWARMSS